LTSTDWNTFNNKQPAGAYLTTVTADAPLTGSGTSGSHLSIPAATSSVNGYLTSTDWTTFNNKAPGTTYTTNYIPYGQGTTTLNQSSSFTYDGTTITAPKVAATASVSGSGNKGAISYGTLSYSDSNHLATFQTAVNAYAQVEIQNTQAGTAASADMVVGNDLTTSSTYYGDFGINSSLFSGTGSLGLPNATYLTATTGDLSLGTTTSNSIHFVIGGSATDAMTINTSGALALNGSYGTAGKVLTSSGSGAAPTWSTVSATPAGSTTQVQYNNAGSFGASSNFTYDSSTGTLAAPAVQASNGLVLNKNTNTTSYTIPTGDNAMSVGPFTTAGGTSITVPAGSRWIIL
jgi:hypothetical protein